MVTSAMGAETVRAALVSFPIWLTVEAGMDTWVLLTPLVISGLMTMLSLWFSTASWTSLLPAAALTTVLAVPFWTVVFVGVLLVAVPPELEPPPLGVELVTVTWTWIVAVL